MCAFGPSTFGALAAKEKDRGYVLGDHGFIYTSPYVNTRHTSRNAITILITANLQPFYLEYKNSGAWLNGAVIGSGVARSLHALDVELVSINVDPLHAFFGALAKATRTQAVLPLSRQIFSQYDEKVTSLYHGTLAPSEIQRSFDGIVQRAAEYLNCVIPENHTRNHILRLMVAHPKMSLAELAANLHVSYSTASRIFCEAFGMPLRSFQYAQKMLCCVKDIQGGHSLTRVAHDHGFTDSAHFSNAWRRAYGMHPSYIANKSACELQFFDNTIFADAMLSAI